MLAGGMAAAVPSMVPEAAAAGQLFVSAENANFDNYFAGANVVEIIVKDPNRNATNEQQSEPTVKVNEFPIRMVQGLDGNWYGYIADTAQVVLADDNSRLSYGSTTDLGTNIVTFNSNITTYFGTSTDNIVEGAPVMSNVNNVNAVVDTNVNIGQIGVDIIDWPFIQTLDFTIETFEIKLEQPGADEIVVLKHDSDDIDDYSSLTLDRNAATQGAQIHLTITDQALNIDPTSEDVVMFKVVDAAEGVSFKHAPADTVTNYVAFSNEFDLNGKLKINYNANSAKNLAGTLTAAIVDDATLDDTTADKYLIFFETAENSGVFVNTDDNDDSSLEVNSLGLRGTTATFDYADSAQSFDCT